MTIRARLTLTYTVLMIVVAALLALGVFLFMTYVPAYDIPTTVTPVPGNPHPTTSSVTEGTATPVTSLFPVRSKQDILTTLLIASAGALVLISGLAAGFGWLVTGRLLRPLHEIADAARRAGAGHLDHRIDRPGPPDELKELADTFDVMLARLEVSMHTYRRFAANASHELRTPLATTQALLDLAITGPPEQDVRALATRLRTINSRNIETVDALFDLADAAETEPRREPVDLRELVGQVLTAVAPEAEGIGVSVSLVDVQLAGDPVLLRQLLTNLVQNALRHNHSGGSVRLTAALDGPAVSLQITNTGPVVPAETVPMLTEPFYRANGRTAGGHGLGLALAATIADGHGGRLSITANPAGGLTVTVTLPRGDHVFR
ncbi:sensor histidine kinase [Kutzneria sp. NPDC052558]|uniref:sensor histidine kinase n=1 Tax=Kutzneria sp. NPDC052558 TaxID=3364121 RepID=UPI0037CBB50E